MHELIDVIYCRSKFKLLDAIHCIQEEAKMYLRAKNSFNFFKSVLQLVSYICTAELHVL